MLSVSSQIQNGSWLEILTPSHVGSVPGIDDLQIAKI